MACLVLDLDETLVHSSFKMTHHADYVLPIEIEGRPHNVFVLKRPGVDTFMKRMGELYEIVVFTASMPMYADAVLDKVDIHQVVRHRLYRDSCFHYKGTYVKDLSQLGRNLTQVIILDNSPLSYIFHTANAIPITTWFQDPHDSELIDLIPFLEDLAPRDIDVTEILDNTIPGPFSHL
ncbi:HAD-like domain-containing protein [Gongronella butleri]|nr:HAD-like domain-containing protein [Gongronella butleri]